MRVGFLGAGFLGAVSLSQSAKEYEAIKGAFREKNMAVNLFQELPASLQKTNKKEAMI